MIGGELGLSVSLVEGLPLCGDFGWKVISNPNFTVQRIFP